MHENYYVLKNFEIYPEKNGIIFYTPEISAHINYLPLINFLNDVKVNKIVEIDEYNLKKLLNKYDLVGSAVLDYLFKELKFISVTNPNQFENLVIVTNEIILENNLRQYFTSGYGLEISSQDAVNDKSLVIAMHYQYQAKQIEELYALISKSKAWIINAYIASHYLIIDNIYHTQKGMPCHFCNINRHQQIVKSTNPLRKTSWVNVCRQGMHQDPLTLPAMQLTTVEHGLVLFWLTKIIKNFVSTFSPRVMLNEVMKYSWINLITGEMNQEQAVHWPICPCLQG